MKLDVRLDSSDLANAAAAARMVRQRGAAVAWFSERAAADPFCALAAAAAEPTPGLALGTGIAVMAARTPMAMAQSAWQIVRHSDLPFLLGLGTQTRSHVTRRYSAEWHEPDTWVSDYVACLRAIWSVWQHGGRPDYEGPFFRFTLINEEFDPGAVAADVYPPRIWLTAVNPGAFRRVGRLADGVHVHAFHTPSFLRDVALPTLREAGRFGDGPVPGTTPAFLGVAHTQEQAELLREEFRHHIAFYCSTPSYRPLLRHLDLEELHERCRIVAGEHRWGDLDGLVSDEVLDAFSFVGTATEVAGEGVRRYGDLLTHLGLYRTGTRFMTDDDWREIARGFERGAVPASITGSGAGTSVPGGTAGVGR